MSRSDLLTNLLLEDNLADAEAAELHELLAGDTHAQGRHLDLVRLEVTLRGLRTEFAFAEPTVTKIEAERVVRTTTAVMNRLPSRLPIAPSRSSRLWVAVSALAAVLLIGIGFWQARPPAEVKFPIAVEFAKLTTVTGSVEVVGSNGALPARIEQVLQPDQTLQTIGEESLAVLEFTDQTRVELHADTAVQVRPLGEAAGLWKIVLLQGRVTATTTGRRIVLGTGTTEMEVSQGSFSLCSSGAGSARVEALHGDVRIVRSEPAEPMVLSPGRAAYVSEEQTLVRVESSSRIDSIPEAQLNFMALDVAFTPTGEVLAVSAKQWARWRPGSPDPGRITFLPRVFNDGLAAKLTPDLQSVTLCRIDDREEQISVRTLLTGEEQGRIPVRVSEPRFLCVASDASWLATMNGQKSQKKTILVWDVETGTERFTCELNHSVNCLAASPDGKWLAVGVSDLGRGTDNAIVLFDTVTGERVLELPTKRKTILSLAFTSDGKHLAGGFNGAVQVWNIADRKLVRTLEGFERVVTTLAFSAQGDLLAAGTQDGQVWVWSAATGQRRQVIEAGTRGVRSVAFRADGKRLVTTTNKAGVAVWEVAPEPTKGAEPDL